MSRNLPPLNTILAGSAGEILPSEVTDQDFDGWAAQGTDLVQYDIEVRNEAAAT